jgi:hypothetical protein
MAVTSTAMTNDQLVSLPIWLAALGQDLGGDGEDDLAFLVARLDVGGDDTSVGTRLEADLVGELA